MAGNTHPIPAVFCWSGGKDSAYALHLVRLQGVYDVRLLISTVNGLHGRLSMHGIREQLMDVQAAALGLPLQKVYVYGGSNEEYERVMNTALAAAAAEGVRHVIYGDIFLEDLKAWRERQLHALDMEGVYPLWKMDTKQLAFDFIDAGFKTRICCVNGRYLDAGCCGRLLDTGFLNELPAGVDPCGENGEFHSFCYDGPVFQQPVAHIVGETVHRPMMLNGPDGTTQSIDFWYADLLPVPPGK